MSKCRNCGDEYKSRGWGVDFCCDRCRREYYEAHPEAEASDKSVNSFMNKVGVAFLIGLVLYFLIHGC